MSLKDFKSIGDQLTTNEFNGLISMYRNFVTHKDEFDIQDTVIGDYGKYCFDIQDTTVLDSGLLVTSETISAEPKVKLMDNVFKNSTYTLILEVIHYTGASILDDDPTDFKVTETLEIELVPNEWVPIPVTDIEAGYIISFDAKVNIKHDQTERQGNWVNNITLTSNKDIIQTDETATLTATVTDIGDIHVAGRTVTFKAYKNGTLVETIGTDTTDNNGEATVSYTGQANGLLQIQAECNNLTDTYSLLDCIAYDNGIADDYDNIWTSSNSTLYRDTQYSTVTQTTESFGSIYLPFTDDIDHVCFEFDISTDTTETWNITS